MADPRAYLAALVRHRYHPLWEELDWVADAVQQFLDTGDRAALGDPDTLRSALERLEAYNEFQPDRFDRRAINAQFRNRVIGAGGDS